MIGSARHNYRVILTAWILAALSVLLHGSATEAAEPKAAPSRGLVDGSAFAGLAEEDSEVVEIHLGGSLLKALSRADASDEGLGELARGLDSITAYIVGLGADSERIEKAARLIQDTEARLTREGWSSLARVREQDERVHVLVRNDEQTVDGLVVLVLDQGEGEVVFVNIAGQIDLALLGQLHEGLDVPGLSALDEIESSDSAGESSRDKPR